MRVLLAVFVLLMILAVTSCWYWFGYRGTPYATGLCEGRPRWTINVYDTQFVFDYGEANPPEGFFLERHGFSVPWFRFLRPVYYRSVCESPDGTCEPIACRYFGIPLLPFALLCLALWAFLFWKQKMRRRLLAWLASGPLCHSCDYNLTGNTSGTCPECGTAIPDDVKQEIKTPPADDPAG